MKRSSSRATVLMAVHSARPGGAQAMALKEAAAFAPSYDLVISVPPGPLRAGFAEHGEIVRGVPTLPLWGASTARWTLQLARTVLCAVPLAVDMRRRGVDLVVTSSSVLLAPVLAARVAGIPVVAHAREEPLTPPGRPLFRTLERLADTVIPVSGAVERHFTGSHRAKLVRIPDGIVLPERPAPARNGFGTPLRLCLVGSIAGKRGKGQDLAVEVLGRLVALGVPASLDLVGPVESPEFAAELQRRASELDVAELVTFTGPVDSAGPAMTAADIVLSCSRAEALPLVMMEALAHETPVVAMDVGGLTEVVTDGETGVLVPAGDPDAAAAAIVGLLNDPARARAMARRGREEIARRFSLERTVLDVRRELERELAR
jgi:glycosyltransferase involved in cell wall biosynthesis